VRQDTTQAILADRLDIIYIFQIRTCQTIKQMLEKLDGEFKISTEVGLITARKKYLNLTYNIGRDMRKYIAVHKARADEYEKAGGTISDEDRVLNLHSSLPAKYDHIFNYYRLSTDAKNYETYRSLSHGELQERNFHGSIECKIRK